MNNDLPDKSDSGGILVIIPCHNESGRIGNVVQQIRRILPGVDIAVVDDASSDESPEEARREGATVLSHCTNLGYGAALETGYLYANSRSYRMVLQMDGDGQHDASQLPGLLAPIAGGSADIAIGSRYAAGTSLQASTLIRRVGHKLFSAIIFLLCGLKISDPTSGFQALNRRALSLFSSGNFPCDFPDSDVILMAKMSGLRIVEVPTRMFPRAGGESMHSGLKPLYYGIKMFLSIFIVLINFNTWRSWKNRNDEQTASLQ